ncbi:MAG: hypothetical protein ABSG90_00700 [Dehalococcoidia bacterium]
MDKTEIVIVTGRMYDKNHLKKGEQPSIRLNQYHRLVETYGEKTMGKNPIEIILKSYDNIQFEVELHINNSEGYINCPKTKDASEYDEFCIGLIDTAEARQFLFSFARERHSCSRALRI